MPATDNGSLLLRYIDPQVLTELAGRGFEPQGLVGGHLAGGHKSPWSGFAVEFAGHRGYVPGDDPKHLDWRVYFHSEKYVTKQYELETNLVAYLVIDSSHSMGYGGGGQQKWQYACRLAMTLARLIVRTRDQVTLALMGEESPPPPPKNTHVQLVQMARQLDGARLQGAVDVGSCLEAAAGYASRRSVVFVVSDFFTDLASLEKGVQRLRFDRRQVVLLQVVHADECDFPFDGAIEFSGLEVDERLRTSPREIRASYLRALQEHQQRLLELCYRSGCEHVLVRTDRPLAQQLVGYLDRRRRTP